MALPQDTNSPLATTASAEPLVQDYEPEPATTVSGANSPTIGGRTLVQDDNPPTLAGA